MLARSDLYMDLLNARGTKVETKALIAGVEYSGSALLHDANGAALYPRSTAELFAEGRPTVGSCVAGELDLTVVKGISPVPRMAKIEIFSRLVNGDMASEWLPKGVYYVDTRADDGITIAFHCFDPMLKMETSFLAAGESSGTWPRPAPAVMASIAERIGVELDPRNILDETCMVPYPEDYTMREIAGFIAAMHAGNWIFSPSGKLRLVPLVPTPTELGLVLAASKLGTADEFEPFSGVRIWYDDTDTCAAGDDTGRVLEIECPWATQAIADAVLASIQGYVYRPFSATKAYLDPAAELGDVIKVNGVESVLAVVNTNFDAACTADIAAPAEEEIDHEYPYESKTKRETQRKIAKAKADIQVGIDEIKLQVEDVNGNVSSLEQTVDGIELSVVEAAGSDGNKYATIKLTVGENTYTGQILMEGNINVSGQLSADALYAALGDIADLTVDKLSTSRRIVKYLAGDTSDDNYITAVDEQLSFVSGVYAGGTEQAKNPNGLPIYWESDPDADGVVLGADGYPYLDGVRIYTTTGVTDWPVTVYTYTELVKSKIAFELDGDTYVPVLTMGAGDGNGKEQFRMVKGTGGTDLLYTAANGKEIGIAMGADGYLDIKGQRAITAIAVTEAADGSVTITNTLEGGVTETIGITPDASGNPATLTYNGTAIPITWEEVGA